MIKALKHNRFFFLKYIKLRHADICNKWLIADARCTLTPSRPPLRPLLLVLHPTRRMCPSLYVYKCELGDLCPILAVRSAIQRFGSHFGNECRPRAMKSNGRPRLCTTHMLCTGARHASDFRANQCKLLV